MPELPEVETTRRGVAPYVQGAQIERAIVNHAKLRWPIPPTLPGRLHGATIVALERRAKYLLFRCTAESSDLGHLIVHLGMSGSLRMTERELPFRKHDHFVLRFTNGTDLRLHDPRRFGAVLWKKGDALQHPLLKNLGPEPLSEAFNAISLQRSCQHRKVAIKQHIMNSRVVVGVGNIYANEALFLAGINPKRAAGNLSMQRLERLVAAIKQVLSEAISQGGTTLRDFVREDGEPGYFKLFLNTYGRTGEPCHHCGTPIRQQVIGQRSTFYCPKCQRY